MSGFADVETTWASRLGSLRNVVRQSLVRTQIHEHLEGVETVLDVGCGQGTQAIELAARGLEVTGVDPSVDLLALAEQAAEVRAVDVSMLRGTIDDLDDLLPGRTFDLVCAHGLLMYLPDPEKAVRQLAQRVAPGGVVSFTVRNGEALAYRPGVRGDWEAALRAFGADTYTNELGVRAAAHRLEEALAWCRGVGCEVEAWYGVRVFTDGVDPDTRPDDRTLAACLKVEEEAGRRDPYRRLASQLHIIARARGSHAAA
ncbi:methyltransferase domain-containing protein [Mumia sp. zg.B53]|uniref:class I SAM-dependent methyltransferase n=1 Tax=Mumia sp. zg.B53 TaxID=2855449 RepID=UPI001C6E312E|nr:class I SAM-dependent methyltransferase [Mumia sp. zg.B53]MBW9215577.1 methyltransferase domain-containing protein [Mumia sp. zg.B53]